MPMQHVSGMSIADLRELTRVRLCREMSEHNEAFSRDLDLDLGYSYGYGAVPRHSTSEPLYWDTNNNLGNEAMNVADAIR
jgi:hypothetical protein